MLHLENCHAVRCGCAASASKLLRRREVKAVQALSSLSLFFSSFLPSPSSPLHGHMAFRTVSDGLDTRRRTRMTCQHMHTHWPPQLFVSQGSRIIVGLLLLLLCEHTFFGAHKKKRIQRKLQCPQSTLLSVNTRLVRNVSNCVHRVIHQRTMPPLSPTS